VHDVIHLDGNAVAGSLEEIFGRDVTVASGRCVACGAVRELGAVHVYRGAGVVARCPDCHSVLFRIVHADDRLFVDLQGIATLQVRN
jgi:hypothetical protein